MLARTYSTGRVSCYQRQPVATSYLGDLASSEPHFAPLKRGVKIKIQCLVHGVVGRAE